MKHDSVIEILLELLPAFEPSAKRRTLQGLWKGSIAQRTYCGGGGQGCLFASLSAGVIRSDAELAAWFVDGPGRAIPEGFSKAALVLSAWDGSALPPRAVIRALRRHLRQIGEPTDSPAPRPTRGENGNEHHRQAI